MKLNEIKNLQTFFLNVIYSNPEINVENFYSAQEFKYFHADTFHRIQAYRESFYARVSSVFSQTIFDLASLLFGKNFIEKYLVDYFYHNPTVLNMTDSVKNFGSFLESQEEMQYCPFVPDFVKFCYSIQEILSATDPTSNFLPIDISSTENIYLQKEHIIFNSPWPIFQMYNAAKELQEITEKNPNAEENLDNERETKLSHITNNSENVILFKSQRWSLDVIVIPKEFSAIMNLLSKGNSLHYAIDNSEIDQENFNLEKFSQWISTLTKQNAFINQSIF